MQVASTASGLGGVDRGASIMETNIEKDGQSIDGGSPKSQATFRARAMTQQNRDDVSSGSDFFTVKPTTPWIGGVRSHIQTGAPYSKLDKLSRQHCAQPGRRSKSTNCERSVT